MNQHGVKITDTIEGSGNTATGDVWVKLRTRVNLNRGDELPGLWGDDNLACCCFRLQDREIIPGLRYAAEGMRAGGKRAVVIPPHLAYGDAGIPDLIPPNAVLRAEIELLEVGNPGEPVPTVPQLTKYNAMQIREWREESSLLPRWQLVLNDRNDPHHPSYSGLALEWSTRSDGKWGARSTEHLNVMLDLDPDHIERMIDSGNHLPRTFPDECLDSNGVHSHGGVSPTRSNHGSVICRSISFVKDGEYAGHLYIREDSHIWTSTEWGRQIMDWVTPHLTEAPWRQRQRNQQSNG